MRNIKSDHMKEIISVTEAARTVPGRKKVCTGRELVSALAGAKLSPEEAEAWNMDLRSARAHLTLLAKQKL
jgi:hypothetical protein